MGLGSPHGDDQAGWAVASRLEGAAGVTAVIVRGGAELLLAWEGFDEVVVVDAAAPAGRPGRVTRREWPAPDLESTPLASTHGLGLADALRMAEALGSLPGRLIIYTIEAAATEPLAPLGKAAARAADELATRLLAGE